MANTKGINLRREDVLGSNVAWYHTVMDAHNITSMRALLTGGYRGRACRPTILITAPIVVPHLY